MKSICVFCASSPGEDPRLLESARALGRELATRKIRLVYGGSNVGLMGAVADAALTAGGAVTGVLPRFLQDKEIAHGGLNELLLCDTMHERKTKMFELSEGFIALPGGFGTLEEVIEILTWQQLGLHKFPVAFLNVAGFYDSLRALFEKMESAKLLKPENKRMALFADDIPALFTQMASYRAPTVDKWLGKKTT